MSEVTRKYKEKEKGTTADTTRNLFRLTITNAKNNMQIYAKQARRGGKTMFVYASVGPVFSSVSLDATLTLSDTHTHTLTNYCAHTLLAAYSPGHEDRSELR